MVPSLEGKAPQRRPQERLDRRSEEIAKAVGGGYCRLEMPLELELSVWGHWLGMGLAHWKGDPPPPPPSNASLSITSLDPRHSPAHPTHLGCS